MVQASTLCMVCLEAFGLGFGADLVSRAADPEVSREQAPATRQASTPNPKIYALETAASIVRNPKPETQSLEQDRWASAYRRVRLIPISPNFSTPTS